MRPLSAPRRPGSATAASKSQPLVDPQVVLPSPNSNNNSNTQQQSSSLLPTELIDKIGSSRVTTGGAVVVSAVTARHLNAPPNTQLTMEYVVTLSPSRRLQESSYCTVPLITSEPVKAVHDIQAGGWTLTFRDIHAIFPIDEDCDGRLGIFATIQSTCGQHHFGSAMCRNPREWCALSRPRGEVQVVFHEVLPTQQQQQLEGSSVQQQQQQQQQQQTNGLASLSSSSRPQLYQSSSNVTTPLLNSSSQQSRSAGGASGLPASSAFHGATTPTASSILSSFASRPATAHSRTTFGGPLGRPNTASALGRAPLGALQHQQQQHHPYSVNSGMNSFGGGSGATGGGGGGGRYPPSPPRPTSAYTTTAGGGGAASWNSGRPVIGGGGANPTAALNNKNNNNNASESIAAASAATSPLGGGAGGGLSSRTVVFSDWVLEDLPPPPPGLGLDDNSSSGGGGGRYAVYVVTRFAHSELRLLPAAVHSANHIINGASSPNRLADVVAKRKSAGLTSSDDDEDDDEENDGYPPLRGPSSSSSRGGASPHSGRRAAMWPVGVSQTFDVPLVLDETAATFTVYVCDFSEPAGGRFLAETTFHVDQMLNDAASPYTTTTDQQQRPHKQAARITFTGDVKLTATFTVQIFRREAQKEGAGGRPTSAFPRRSGNGALQSTNSGQYHPPGPPPPTPAQQQQQQQQQHYQPQQQNSSLDEVLIPDDDFVAEDVDDDDEDGDGYDGTAESDHNYNPNTRGVRGGHHHHMGNGAAHHNATVPARMNGAATTTSTTTTTTSSAAARKNSLNALAEAFESTLHTTLRNSFASILDRLGTIEKRVTSVEERIHAHMSSSSHTAAAAASSGAGMTISVRPMSASDTDASALGTPASGPHNTTDVGVGGSGGGATFLPSTPHAPPSASSTFLNHSSAPGSASSHRGGGVAAAANSATSMSITSRPNSGDNNSSYRGATLFPDAAFPEHGNPLFTEQQLEQKFRRYDVDGRGLLTKAQLVHFYRTHNSFSFDETSDDIESELRRFACPRLDDDAVTFNQFCLVALRLAKF